MPLLEEEPAVIIRNLLVTNWNAANIGEPFEEAWVSTGRYDNSTSHAEVTLTTFSEDTSPDGIDPSGKGLTSWVDGVGQIGVWVPLTDDYASAGVAKDFRYDLKREVHRILENNQEGTTDSNGDPQLTRIETGSIEQFIEDNDSPPIYRAVVPVGYQYHSKPQ